MSMGGGGSSGTSTTTVNQLDPSVKPMAQEYVHRAYEITNGIDTNYLAAYKKYPLSTINADVRQGAGLTVNITNVVSGTINGVSVNTAGAQYLAGSFVNVVAGDHTAILRINSVNSAGGVTGLWIYHPGGAAYSVASNLTTRLADYYSPTWAEFQPLASVTPDGAAHYPEVDGLEALALRFSNGNPNVTKGYRYVEDVIEGKFNAGNNFVSNDSATLKTGFVDMENKITGKVTSSYNDRILPLINIPAYVMGDASGVIKAPASAFSDILTRRLNRTTAVIQNNNWQGERKRQSTIPQIALQYSAEDTKNYELLRFAGMSYRLWQQGKLDANYKLWRDDVEIKISKLEVFGNALSRLSGAETYQTQTWHKDRSSGMFGAVGTLFGMAAGAALAIPTGGMSMAAMPAMMAGASVGGGLGGIMGGIAGGGR